MKMDELGELFNRAWMHVFQWKKCAVAFAVLGLCAVLVVFFQGIAEHVSGSFGPSFLFLPMFLSGGLLFPLGVLLIRFYHDEMKHGAVDYWASTKQSFEHAMMTAVVALPFVVAYLALWILLGVVVLFQELPVIGPLLEVLFAFLPVLLNLSFLVLGLLLYVLLFFGTPLCALKKLEMKAAFQFLLNRFQRDPFVAISTFLLAQIPLFVSWFLLNMAAEMSHRGLPYGHSSAFAVVKGFVVSIPYAALLTPALIFFFNFAAECHVHYQKLWKQQEES